jgi:3-oxoadipate enol-lactonase
MRNISTARHKNCIFAPAAQFITAATQKMERSVKDRSIQLDGITITYDDAGTGKVPVIFIHGFPFSKTTWQPQMEFLQKSHRVIAYDIRGFGGSTLGNEVISIDLFATDLIRFMDALKIEKAIVCGLSMGGYIVMNAVGRFPARFEAIVLSDTQCIADSAENKEKRYKTIRQIEEEGLEKFAETFIQNIFSKNALEHKRTVVEEVKNLILKTSPQAITATLKALAERRESCNTLKQINIPALIICGKEDLVTPLSQAELLNNSLVNSTLQPIEKAGHMSNLEQPDIFNEHIHNFLPGFLS